MEVGQKDTMISSITNLFGRHRAGEHDDTDYPNPSLYDYDSYWPHEGSADYSVKHGNLERRIAAILEDPGYGTFARLERACDRIITLRDDY